MSNDLKKIVEQNVLIAMYYIDSAYRALDLHIKEERNCNEKQRNNLYDYGLTIADIHKVKLANIKKSILSITGNKTYSKDDSMFKTLSSPKYMDFLSQY